MLRNAGLVEYGGVMMTADPQESRSTSPFQEFFRTEAAGGAVLVACACAALIVANSAWADAYHRLLATTIAIAAGGHELSLTVHQWINDGLMAVFFLLVGLEIKREALAGELASPRQAALPIAAAIGGMVVPASIYLLTNGGGMASRGWAIPMATDIAFALGVLALVAPRAPSGLKIFLAALAIVDDMGAVLVIALFYTGAIAWGALGMAGLILLLLIALNVLRIRTPDALSGSRCRALVLCARVRRARDDRRRAAGVCDSDPNAHQRRGVLGQGSRLAGRFRSHGDRRPARADQQGPAGSDHRTRASQRRGHGPTASPGTRASRVFGLRGDAALCVLERGRWPERIGRGACDPCRDPGTGRRETTRDYGAPPWPRFGCGWPRFQTASVGRRCTDAPGWVASASRCPCSSPRSPLTARRCSIQPRSGSWAGQSCLASSER